MTFKDRGREDELKALMERRVLVMDGAMGTAIQALDLGPEAFGGHAFEGCNEHLVLTRPEAVAAIHEGYLDAGADIIETNSFGAMRHVLAEYGLQDKTLELNRAAAALAARAAADRSTPDGPRFAAGAMGPGTKSLSLTGGITFEAAMAAAEEQARGLAEGGCDLLLLETQQDTLNLKASLLGIQEAFKALGRSIPVALSVSIEPTGTMLAGQGVEALYASIEHFGWLAVGLNCATGPEFMTDHLRTLSAISRFPTVCYPNAGLPDERGRYHELPEALARVLGRFLEQGWVNVVGGCCGTGPEHIRRISEAAAGARPRSPARGRACVVSGIEHLAIEEARRPYQVGERANVVGSKAFRELIAKDAFDDASEVGRSQVRDGAHILDVCLAGPDRDEREDMAAFLRLLTRKIKVPLMIDSTDPAVIEEALKLCQGKAIINSINLEDGEERFRRVVPLARRFGAAVVVGTIDEDKAQGMALTRERKLSIAGRAHALLTGTYGLADEDIIFDPLTFPCAAGDKACIGGARETIEGLRLIKAAFPRCKTILGVSNVSFGLPPAGREALNSVFLKHCVDAGLDLAIVNPSKLARYSSLSEEERRLAEDVLFWKGPGGPAGTAGPDPVAAFAARFRQARPAGPAGAARARLPLEERLARAVVEGSKEGLAEDLDELAKSRAPLDIINGPLMKGMAEVSRLFGANEMIVAEVLQSAEVMKAAVARLEPRMDAALAGSRGRVLLATVKGDVHEIGKNLVHIILKNNGFAVTDLGIKIAPEALIEAVRRLAPDVVGLSGLLVRSAHQMAVTADDLREAGVKAPLVVGGAALSATFAATRIAPRYGGPVFYAKDAMAGLDIVAQLADPARRQAALDRNREVQAGLAGAPPPPRAPEPGPGRSRVRRDAPVPSPPDLERHVETGFDVDAIFAYLNPVMLYGKHLGLRSPERGRAEADPRGVELYRRVTELQAEIARRRLLRPKAVYQFFPARSEGDSVHVCEAPDGGRVLETFTFPRQPAGERLCLADFVADAASGRSDYVALLAVTCGAGVRELAEASREAGEYLKSHVIESIAIESAEALAELLHERLRSMWGIGDPPDLTLREKFQARYRGRRYSFGFPACPDLKDQERLFRLLEVTRHIGVELTDGCMMDPEASVTAMVLHHPEARYFSAGDGRA